MLALNILDIRRFMAAFLAGSLFDDYALIEAQITTFCSYTIDGRLEKSFFDTPGAQEAAGEDVPDAVPEKPSYIRWQMVREICFDLIKGKRTPLFFKFVFFYPEEQLDAFLRSRGLLPMKEHLSGLCLNLRYDGANLVLTTGTSLRTFTRDRSIDEYWDAYVRELLVSSAILIEDL